MKGGRSKIITESGGCTSEGEAGTGRKVGLIICILCMEERRVEGEGNMEMCVPNTPDLLA